MAGKTRHLVNRSGRYHARLVVPKDLLGIVGKSELRSPLGGDYRQALRLLPGAVAQLQNQIGEAERKSGQVSAAPRYPMAADQMAVAHYNQRLAFDDQLRNDPRYPMIGIDDLLVQRLRDAIAGRAQNEELEALVGPEVERFRAAGNFDDAKGSDEWRKIARALCSAEYEALERVYERDEGDFTGTPTTPILVNAEPPTKPEKNLSIKRLWSDYVAIRKQAGFMRDGGKRQGAVIDNLRKYLKHDDARRITKKNVLDWRDHLMTTLAAKTVSDVYLSTVRALFQWAVDNDQLPDNPASSVKQPKPRKVYNRERGYTDAEAVKVLKASRSYESNEDVNGYIREKPELAAAKRWVPIICAFTGARVSEITQLRKEDIRHDDGMWIARITPDAGSVKAGGYRDVPLHPQIIVEGFADFHKDAGQGPLFHNGSTLDSYVRKSKQISNQLADWLRLTGLRPEGLAPNHAWRHRLKTQCMELGISDRVMDAIQGHAGRTAGDSYGDVTLNTKRDAIEKLPKYGLET
jgi:integrase